MASRLDRLFMLLDNGSTPLTRKAAALQLGEVQKLHPHELNTLLTKVRQYLHSASWETRIAASQAVEAIISNVSMWFPSGIKEETNDESLENNSQTINNSTGRMMFERYDVRTVIRCGYNLLASEGKDFDQEDCTNQQMGASVDNRESIARMRQSLNQRLGLNFGLQIDFISNSDLETNPTVKTEPNEHISETKLEDVITQATGRTLKRKPPPNIQTTDLADPKKVKMEIKEEENLMAQDSSVVDSDEWPLSWFTDELMSDLFNAQWEVRHGAAIGLREIVKLQGRCGGRVKSASSICMDRLNQQWLEDLSLRLLSVLALDKFGDFLSDQVVAPVRETCAQVLGLIIRLLTKDGVQNVLKILLQLLQCPEWEARHGGMLGLKYLLATRRDMIEQLLPEVFEPIFNGLQDQEDDVSAVAAAALVPVKDDLMRLIPTKVPLVITFLWEALLVLDDLSSSTGDLLMLLSSLLTFKGLNEDGNPLLAHDQLVTLIPRLWPFLSHSLTSVRKSVLESLLILSQKCSPAWLSPELLSDALRLLYQRSLVENHHSILELIYKVWLSLISKASYQCLIEATKNYVTGWMFLMMQPQKIPIDVSNTPVWLEIKHSSQNHIKTRHHQEITPSHCTLPASYFIGGSETLGESSEERKRSAIRARYQCARLIGLLAFYLTEGSGSTTGSELSAQDALDSFATILLMPLNTKSAVQRMCCAWIIREWSTAKIEHHKNVMSIKSEMENEQPKPKIDLHKSLIERCIASLEEQIFFDEISTFVSRVQFNFRDLLQVLRLNKVQFNEEGLAGKTVYTFTQINGVIGDVSGKAMVEIRKKLAEAKKPSAKLKALLESIEEKIQSIQRSMQELNNSTTALTVAVKSSLASALISWQVLPEKLSPIIKPVMDSIKAEENEQLQRGSASSLVKLLNIFCERKDRNSMTSTPTQKIINNLITYLCSDKNFTPEVKLEPKSSAQYGILALENMQKMAEKNTALRRSNSINMKNRNLTSNDDASTSNGQSGQNFLDQEKSGEIQRRGATLALSEISRFFGSKLSDQLPSLWEYITKISHAEKLPTFDEEGLQNCRNLVQALQVFEIIGPHLDPALHPTLICAYDFLCQCLQSPYIAVRHMAARCFGMLASILPNPTMNVILTKVLDMLEAADCELKRQGAVEAIYFVIDRLSLKIVPYIVLLIVPMLGRMSDQNENVRLLATHCFAQLVQLMPLDNDHHHHAHNHNEKNMEKDSKTITNGSITSYKQVLDSGDIELSEDLLKRKENQRRFLEQLMNIKKLDDYKLPIPVRAELRQYQQDGLNWLAFLNKYKLHGIVADEMGLGKTLQAICILASDFYYQKQRYRSKESSNKPLLSLVICPPTLTGHWLYEVDKFVSSEHLCPILYTGPPIERTKIRSQIKKALDNITNDRKKNYNLIIASYDLVRNDIDFFSSINWNYCILDEGHVIKNGKTKLAKSIKTLKANHRLILTGTPIQNNVLELWSLFDFLMPGFLGTERQFMARYSKPILASRDAKSSSKEQEAGILAMENLHRQVLPFILRRMKEDVLKDLPPKIMQDYYCELSPLQAQLYEDFYKSRARQTLKDSIDSEVEEITSPKNSQKKTGHDSLSKSHIFQSLQYLRKVCNHPKLVLTPSHPNYSAIMEQLKHDHTTLSDINHAAKLGALKQLLQDCGIGVQNDSDEPTTVVNQHRALIFCQLKSMLDIVEKDLFKIHMPSVSYLRLDGDVPAASRYSVIHQFNNDPSIDVLLLTIQVGGLGLNLTGADTVIFVEHDWNPMKDLQAMDRAHRIGQKKVVNVYRLITTGTLEEKIMGLQKFKLTIANTVISSENSSLDSMATDQLLDLFELSSEKQQQKEGRMLPSSSSNYTGETGGQVSMKMMLESLPELWDTQQYENEYDMNNFLQSLSHL